MAKNASRGKIGDVGRREAARQKKETISSRAGGVSSRANRGTSG